MDCGVRGAQCTLYLVKRYTAAQARQHLSDVLDHAESGEPVVIERRGVRFAVRAERKSAARRRAPVTTWLDPAVESGNWTWTWTRKGLAFTARSRRRR
jgi:antitoxin (DNA-binding transcriptional repressor) of toxin-antitoxin stability system